MWSRVYEIEAEPGAPPIAGRSLHGWFFHEIARRDQAVADRLHRAGEARPFTWAVLGSTALRLAVFEPELESLLERKPLFGSGEPAEIDGHPLRARRTFEPGEHEWAGRASFVRLLSEAEPISPLHVEFVTPTAFRAGDIDLPLPVPRLIIGSWMRAWNALADVRIPAEFEEQLSRSAALVDFDIRPAPAGGFTGRIELKISGPCDEPARRALDALAGFAFYCGTGRKTAMGMGLTRRLVRPSEPS